MTTETPEERRRRIVRAMAAKQRSFLVAQAEIYEDQSELPEPDGHCFKNHYERKRAIHLASEYWEWKAGRNIRGKWR